MNSGGFPRISAAQAPAGRLWVALASLLLVVSIGSWLYLVIALGIEGSTCFDVKHLPETQRLCDAEKRRVAGAWRLVILVASVSAALMALVGLFEGMQRRRFASGRRQPLRVLVAVSPAAMLGYLLGHVLGRLLPELSRRPPWSGRGKPQATGAPAGSGGAGSGGAAAA
jgi:hypothetical protein